MNYSINFEIYMIKTMNKIFVSLSLMQKEGQVKFLRYFNL